MSEVLVICPNHGIIKRIEMACMWLGRPPMPEVENAFCPLCGSPTIIERPKHDHQAKSWTYDRKKDNEYKDSEIKFYRTKYKKEFNLKDNEI